MATLACQPSLPGTENSCLSAREAGPAAAMPATVATTQKATTMRWGARTQRVSEDTATSENRSPEGFNHLYHKRLTPRKMPSPMRYDQPPPEPLASAVGFLLSWNGQRIPPRFATALLPLGLRPPHFGVMNL